MKRLIMTICILIVLMGAAAQTQAQSEECSRALAPHLKKGDQVQVTKPSSKEIPAAFLKVEAGRAAPVLRYLPVGTVVEVVDGPTCGDDRGYWWQVQLGELTGWMAEVSDKAYALEPATGPAPTPLPSTVTQVVSCIQPIPQALDNPPTKEPPVLRTVFSTLEGELKVSDNGRVGRTLASFNPPPLSVDLSPDGTAALVVTYNGVYWVDTAKGATVLVADATNLGLAEGAWPSYVKWLPDSRRAALEIVDRRSDVDDYSVWSVALDGSQPPLRIDAGAQRADGIKRSPSGKQVIVISTNDMTRFPQQINETMEPLIVFVPRGSDSDPNGFVRPAIAWKPDDQGFYTYIPVSEVSPDDPAGGRLWYAPVVGEPENLGPIRNVRQTDYVIPSPTGEAVLSGPRPAWVMRNVKSGAILQSLPPGALPFDWTPDGKGVVFMDRTGAAKYLGIDGSDAYEFMPTDAVGLFDIKWLPDGTVFYVIRGKDGKLSFKVRRPGDEDKFLGIISTVSAYSGWLVPAEGTAKVPEPCK